jgi:hypothetical protein
MVPGEYPPWSGSVNNYFLYGVFSSIFKLRLLRELDITYQNREANKELQIPQDPRFQIAIL